MEQIIPAKKNFKAYIFYLVRCGRRCGIHTTEIFESGKQMAAKEDHTWAEIGLLI